MQQGRNWQFSKIRFSVDLENNGKNKKIKIYFISENKVYFYKRNTTHRNNKNKIILNTKRRLLQKQPNSDTSWLHTHDDV